MMIGDRCDLCRSLAAPLFEATRSPPPTSEDRLKSRESSSRLALLCR